MKRNIEIGEPFDRAMEAETLQIARAISNVNAPMVRLLRQRKLTDVGEDCYNVYDKFAKKQGKKKGLEGYYDQHKSYGYYISEDYIIPHIYEWMLRLNCKSFLDLGCGMNLLSNMLKQINEYFSNSEIKFSGIEKNAKLIEYSKTFFGDCIGVKEGDLLKITKEDVAHADVLYMYEPIFNKKLAKKFVNRLVRMINYDQTIILNSTGNIKGFLNKHPNIHILCETHYDIGLVILHKTTPYRKKKKLEETVF